MSAPADAGRRIFTIPPGVPFLATFAASFLAGGIVPGAGAGDDPARLAGSVIFVPTRRSARALAAEFARALNRPAVLLPKIVPLGGLEEIETGLSFQDNPFDASSFAGLPEAVDETGRRLVLTRLILEWARQLRHAIVSIDSKGKRAVAENEPLLVAASPAQAWQLSADLAALIDDLIIEGVEWDALTNLAPENFDHYWRITLEFLKIATVGWREHLARHEMIDAAERQKRLAEMEMARLSAGASTHPVIAIGSTGAIPSTARLLGAIAGLPNGAIVLPGLDKHLDEAAWALIAGDEAQRAAPADGHPQAVLRRLLKNLGAARADVVEIGIPAPPLAMRARFISEALRPADATDEWFAFFQSNRNGFSAALAGLTLIEAADERVEALCLAIAARRLLEEEGVTGALITPDRALALRVKGELARWGIEVDDSGGEPLSLMPAGILARLVLAAAPPEWSAMDWIALLAHPLTRLGRDGGELRRLSRLLEAGVWRAIPAAGLDARAVIEQARGAADSREAHPAAKSISDGDWDALQALLADIAAALQPLRALAAGAALSEWISAHRAALARVAGEPAGDEDWMSLDALFEAFANPNPLGMRMAAAEYAALIDAAISGTVVRSPRRAHPRFQMLGPLEARLLHADVVLLGGLDETIWPPVPGADPFLNRPMRAALGLASPERRLGQTAHDFTSAMGAPRVIISRARKRGGAPSVPSRLLQRMAALAGADEWQKCQERGAVVILLAAAIDAGPPVTILRPAPKPPLELRPKSLSVTRVETLRRDPYGIYAERILRLLPLGPVAPEPGAREMGNFLHDLVADFARSYPSGPLPPSALQALRGRAAEKFARLLAREEFRVFRWPVIEQALADYVDWESGRRGEIARIEAEQSGRLAITLSDSTIFHLTAQADRIERLHDGTLAVVDFKSGQQPTKKVVAAGFAPQLTLETAMIERGAFASVPASAVIDAVYVKLLGADGIKETSIASKDRPLADLAAEHFAGLRQMLDQFRRLETPYIPQPWPQFLNSFSEYNHLARVKEWSAASDEGGEP